MNLRSTILAALFPLAAMAAGSSAHYSISVETLDGAGAAGASTAYAHGGHMFSPAGNGASAHSENIVGFHATTAPEVTATLLTGGPVPGLPGATFAGANELPTPLSSDAVLTKIKLSNNSIVAALVRPSGVLVKVGDTLAATGGAAISKLYAMSSGAFLAELKPGTGSPAATLANNKLVCFDTGAGIEIVAQSGTVAPGGGSAFQRFRACTGDAIGSVFISAVLNELANVDTGVWVRPVGGALKLLVKEGQNIDLGSGLKRINAVAAFTVTSKSQAEGRVLYGDRAIITRLTIGSEQAHAIVVIPADATSIAGWTLIALTGGPAPGGIGQFATLGLPAAEGTNIAFRATLKVGGGVSTANNAIVIAGGDVIARKGSLAPGTSNVFSGFLDPAAGAPGQASFTAIIAGASTMSDEGLWELRDNVLSLVAREASPAPGLSPLTIRSITRNAHPGGGLGPVFMVMLNGTSVFSRVALYGVPAAGGPAIDIARTGDQFGIGGSMQTLTLIKALKLDIGTQGVSRGYNDTSVFMIGSFGAAHTALIELPVVP